mmetsp:Transcript_19593/g.57160  ORF Transcript_19593/g.57160 Transcript_19593/m.57160 type:complete len:214 (+) Transcript_19593:183-824(+)
MVCRRTAGQPTLAPRCHRRRICSCHLHPWEPGTCLVEAATCRRKSWSRAAGPWREISMRRPLLPRAGRRTPQRQPTGREQVLRARCRMTARQKLPRLLPQMHWACRLRAQGLLTALPQGLVTAPRERPSRRRVESCGRCASPWPRPRACAIFFQSRRTICRPLRAKAGGAYAGPRALQSSHWMLWWRSSLKRASPGDRQGVRVSSSILANSYL